MGALRSPLGALRKPRGAQHSSRSPFWSIWGPILAYFGPMFVHFGRFLGHVGIISIPRPCVPQLTSLFHDIFSRPKKLPRENIVGNPFLFVPYALKHRVNVYALSHAPPAFDPRTITHVARRRVRAGGIRAAIRISTLTSGSAAPAVRP